MIKQLLCTILIALTPVISSVMAVEEAAEQYPDEMPKKTLIFQQERPRKLNDYVLPDQILQKIEAEIFYLKEMFSKKNYQCLPMVNEYEISKVGTLCFYCFVNMNESEHSSFFVDISLPNYRVQTETLTSFQIHKNPLPFDKKWDYPMIVHYWRGYYQTVNEMSWLNIDMAFHHRFQKTGKKEQKIENGVYKKLYKDIQSFGLEECLSRILITKCHNGEMYNYYSLSNNTDEHNKISRHFTCLVHPQKTFSFCNIF